MSGRILAAGVDVVEVGRLEEIVRRRPAILERVFHAAERQAAAGFGLPAGSGDGFAAFFGLKEAALKALGTGWGQGLGWKDVRIVLSRRGRIRLVASPAAQARMRLLGGRIFVADATAGGGYALATVLLVE